MSAKWVRSKRWDDEHLRGPLRPLRLVLRAFSSITLAVVLLLCVVMYAILASVPIGLIALAPTYLIYGLTLLGMILLVAGLPVGIGSKVSRAWPPGRRFVVLFILGIGLTAGAVGLWAMAVWPALHYDPATGAGLRLFAGFVDANKAITVRRLPILEMSELEFYAWWPLRLVLILFIVNLVTATVRRIEFSFPYLGVLSVHTGIVLIALGSIYYSKDKVEGDILLLAGQPGPDGAPTAGPQQRTFYDHLQTALHFQVDGMWFQRPLSGLPRYNDYGLSVTGGRTVRDEIDAHILGDDGGRTLDIPVEGATGMPRMGPGPQLRFRVVGYASYAESMSDWARVDPAQLTAIQPGMSLNPVRFLDLYTTLPQKGQPVPEGIGRKVTRLFMLPEEPKYRISDNYQGVMAIEYTRGMPATRWSDLTTELPEGTEHALVVEAGGERGVYPVQPGTAIDIAGYHLEVQELTPQPRFPIITEGYRDASSSVAIVHVKPPEGVEYDRWVYHRFPEISQDLLAEKNERGMPKRRDADPAIRIGYIDASQFQVYLDEPAGGDGTVRAIVRRQGGPLRVIDGLKEGDAFEMVDRFSIKLGERWVHAEPVERPVIVPESQRDKSMVGTHDKAMVAVEVALVGVDPSSRSGFTEPLWSRTVWLPYAKFLEAEPDKARRVDLPDGRRVLIAFGRLSRMLPGFDLSLTDFEMLAYDHRGAPRDYQSKVMVHCTDGSFESFEHVTKLNNPLRAPFMWSDSRSWIANAWGRVSSGLSPNQFKFSQAGWDAEGWRQSQAQADQGLIPRPFASFTILGVGNNPGIHIIAAGGFLMSVGIPWAFYIKPLIMRARKQKIQKQLAEGTYRKPQREPERAREAVGVEA